MFHLAIEIPEAFVAAATTLAGAIAVLWKTVNTHYKETRLKLEKCDEGHEVMAERMIVMSQKVGKLEGRQSGIEQLSAAVLNRINDLSGNSGSFKSDRDTADDLSGGDSGVDVGPGTST
jgi:hypothetical protein